MQGHAPALGRGDPLRPRTKGGGIVVDKGLVFIVAHVLPLARVRRHRRLPQLQLGAGGRREVALVRACAPAEEGRQADDGARRGAPPRRRRLGRHQGQGEKSFFFLTEIRMRFFRTERAFVSSFCRCCDVLDVEESTPVSKWEGEREETREKEEAN